MGSQICVLQKIHVVNHNGSNFNQSSGALFLSDWIFIWAVVARLHIKKCVKGKAFFYECGQWDGGSLTSFNLGGHGGVAQPNASVLRKSTIRKKKTKLKYLGNSKNWNL